MDLMEKVMIRICYRSGSNATDATSLSGNTKQKNLLFWRGLNFKENY